jgi:hypothetical protein
VFPSETDSVSIVIKGNDVTSPAVTGAVAQLEQATQQHTSLFPGGGSISHNVNPAKTVDTLEMAIAKGDKADQALDMLRADLVPRRSVRSAGSRRTRRVARPSIVTSTTR